MEYFTICNTIANHKKRERPGKTDLSLSCLVGEKNKKKKKKKKDGQQAMKGSS